MEPNLYYAKKTGITPVFLIEFNDLEESSFQVEDLFLKLQESILKMKDGFLKMKEPSLNLWDGSSGLSMILCKLRLLHIIIEPIFKINRKVSKIFCGKPQINKTGKYTMSILAKE